MIYAHIVGMSLLANGNIEFVVDRVVTGRALSGSIRVESPVGFPAQIRRVLKKGIVDEVNASLSTSYGIHQVRLVMFDEEDVERFFQPMSVYEVQTFSGSRMTTREFFITDAGDGVYTGLLKKEVFTWSGNTLTSKATTFYDTDGVTVLETHTETYATLATGQKVIKRVRS